MGSFLLMLLVIAMLVGLALVGGWLLNKIGGDNDDFDEYKGGHG